MSLKDAIKDQVAAFDAWARPWAAGARWHGSTFEFLLFGLKQTWARLFGGLMLALILATHLCWPMQAPMARRDVLVLASVRAQALPIATKIGH